MTGTTTLYGISNCDTIKKARVWMTNRGIEFQFHDYRKQGLDAEMLRSWTEELGWQALINRRGTTWRQLTPEARESLDVESAINIMLDNPAIIKRPLLVKDNRSYLGFNEEQYSKLF
jgi:Spx/MgsR family transcriptional regulator